MAQWSANTFSIEVPEIYQIETTNRCNLSCLACIRLDPRVARPIGFLEPELVKTMVNRGDFAGSYFVELQMYGEPLCASNLQEIVCLVKSTGCRVGMSTNGTLLHKNLPVVSELDYLTISVDSADPTVYEDLRGYPLTELTANIELVLGLSPRPVVDLQVINFWDSEDELPALVALAKNRKWNVTCRAVPDCFLGYRSDNWPKAKAKELCLNPFLSVSIQWDGDVVACCFSAGKDMVYGNLHDRSLKEIWNSPVRHDLIEKMRLEYNIDGMPCMLCYQRSPVLFHQKMLMENIKGGKKYDCMVAA